MCDAELPRERETPPPVVPRSSDDAARGVGVRSERTAAIVVAAIGFVVGLFAVSPIWDQLGWPVLVGGAVCVALAGLARRAALTHASIGVLRRLDVGVESVWRFVGWGVVGSAFSVMISGEVVAGVALLAGGAANMATSRRLGALAVGIAGLALAVLGVGYLRSDQTLGGALLVAIGVAVALLGLVLFTSTAASAGPSRRRSSRRT